MNTMRLRLSAIYYIVALLLLGMGLSACGGADFMPNYFPSAAGETAGSVDAPPTSLGGGSCTIKFSSGMCVVLKRGTDVSYGGEGQEKLCADNLPPIPIQIQGSKVTLHGDEFPDVVVSGHGLPVPITINGKGNTDGKDNIGEGTVDGSGNITINKFTIFVTALGVSGKIPDLTLTTGTAPGSKDLPDMHGVPASGSTMTLVGSIVMGSVIPAADDYLLGTTMQVTFTGTVAPKLSECSGAGSSLPTTIQVTKITTDDQKQQHEQLIPSGTQMEVANSILIPETTNDVGAQFEGSSRFRIRNISKDTIPLQIPPIVGAFQIRPVTGDLTESLPPQQSIVVQVSFKPIIGSKTGTLQESLGIGSDTFTLVGVAEAQRGIPSVRVMDTTGSIGNRDTNALTFGDIPVTAFSQQAYFQCDTIQCAGAPAPTRCQSCIDVASGKCQLLSSDSAGMAIDEVDSQCALLRPKARESQSLNLQNNSSTSQTIVIKNTGTKPLTVTALRIAEIAKSHSTQQFQVNSSTVYMGTDASVVGTTAPVSLPATLPAHSDQMLFIVVTYAPTDLVGAMDDQAGTTALDQAVLVVSTNSDNKNGHMDIKLRGSTTIQEIPPLEIYFKTSIGTQMRGNDSDFPLKGLTQKTQNMAVPVLAKLANSASKTLRITNVEISGEDAANFSWLDTTDKINAIPDPERCAVSGAPVAIHPNGFDIAPQAYTQQNMPLLGCINFHRDIESKEPKVRFSADLVVTAVELDSRRQPAKRPDGSLAESKVTIHVLAVINPRTGYQVLRLVQTMAILMTHQKAVVAAASSADEIDTLIKLGRAHESDRFLFLGSIVLDPFDEMTIKDEDGSVITTPGDGITSVFRAIDTRPSKFEGSDVLSPYTSLIYDGLAPEGSRGMFFDKEYKAPPKFQASGLRIYTSALSYPGPLETDPNKIPDQLTDCQQVDPCTHGDLLGKGPTDPTKRGVCAFFYASAASWDSPGMHAKSAQWPDGTRDNLCKNEDKKQDLKTLKGQYFLDGRLEFENEGLRFWGPTFVHNIANTLVRKPPALDEVFHITFSTDVMVPKEEGGKYDYIPEERIDHSKQEYKVNLTDSSHGNKIACDDNTHNKVIGDKTYSSWKYFAPFLVQDKEGKIPAGCPEDDNSFPKTGSYAYLRGRPVDPVTGVFSIAAVTKFGSDEDLTFVFQDVPIYIVLNGWLCDPNGSEAEGEGSLCFSQKFIPRDRLATVSIMKDGK